MEFEQLLLKNQVCFPIYAASHLIVRQYKPYLDTIGITYPQYLVLLVLWEKDKVTVAEICDKLLLQTNTLTPLLKRLESLDLLTRIRSKEDERKVIITLSQKGIDIKKQAAKIPFKLLEKINEKSIPLELLLDLRNNLNRVIEELKQ